MVYRSSCKSASGLDMMFMDDLNRTVLYSRLRGSSDNRHLSPEACSVKPQIIKCRMRCKPKCRMLFMLEKSATLCNPEVGTLDDMSDKPCSTTDAAL